MLTVMSSKFVDLSQRLKQVERREMHPGEFTLEILQQMDSLSPSVHNEPLSLTCTMQLGMQEDEGHLQNAEYSDSGKDPAIVCYEELIAEVHQILETNICPHPLQTS